MIEPKTHTLDAPGAVLHYDMRSNDASSEPVLLLIGSPMGAAGFVTLAGHFTDRTVVTYDPRGAGRSKRTDGASRSTTEEHADDLHRLIGALDAGPVDIFASSGGAVNALALVARHPEQVRTLVAHEPPAAQELPDREPALAACEGIHETYQRRATARRWRNSSRSSATRARSRPVSLTSPGRTPPISGCRPGRWFPGRPARRAEYAFDPRLPARFRRAPCGTDPHRRRRRRAIGPDARRPAPALPWPGGSGRRPSPSRVATTGSSAANTAAPANRTPSPPPCARSSTADGPPGRRVRRPGGGEAGRRAPPQRVGGLRRTAAISVQSRSTQRHWALVSPTLRQASMLRRDASRVSPRRSTGRPDASTTWTRPLTTPTSSVPLWAKGPRWSPLAAV